jgi:hypothetical protein
MDTEAHTTAMPMSSPSAAENLETMSTPVDTEQPRHYYTAESLDLAIGELEREYGMTTEEFYARYAQGEPMEIPHFNQHIWASFRDDRERLTGGAGVERPPVTERIGQALACS